MLQNLEPIHPLTAKKKLEHLTGQRWSLERLSNEMGDYSLSAALKWSCGDRNPSLRTKKDAAKLLAHYESKLEKAIA